MYSSLSMRSLNLQNRIERYRSVTNRVLSLRSQRIAVSDVPWRNCENILKGDHIFRPFGIYRAIKKRPQKNFQR